jgi:hypothetical protein
VRSADNGIGSKPSFNLKLLSSPHIHESKKAVDIHHKVFRLEISIDDSIGVQMLHHKKDLGNELPAVFWGEGNNLSNDVEEVLTLYKLHYEIDEVTIFYQFVEAYHKWEFGHCP